MTNKIINSSNQPFYDKVYSVDCFRKQKKATIVVHYTRIKQSKHDLEKAERLSGWECSITADPKFPCFDCPHRPKLYL